MIDFQLLEFLFLLAKFQNQDFFSFFGILAGKGVNITEIEKQTKTTEDKILELDKKLESFLEVKNNLLIQYD